MSPAPPRAEAGLGLRRAFLEQLAREPAPEVAFWEVAPENWIGVGGAWCKAFAALAERSPVVAHGLSLSLGGPHPLDRHLLGQIKAFLWEHRIQCFSEHLSYSADDRGHLYDLMPIPFTEEAVCYVSARIRQTQDLLEQRIALEPISYYTAPGQRMQEIDFVNAVLTEADCDLLLDLNNIYVNGTNHGYDPLGFLRALPLERVRYAHVAGHLVAHENQLIDTHGEDVDDPVWLLLQQAYQWAGPFPTLLERDFNIPPLAQLRREVARIAHYQHQAQDKRHDRHP